MHLKKTLCGLLVAISLTACGGGTSGGTTTDATTETPGASDQTATIAAIAAEIQANPDDYDAILAKHNMTAAEFEKALYGIASDPKESAAYQAALH